ncbi:TadE/TadG family type IV pilus assembly protein [Alcanivorax quisquiliarum]|uniref:TadE-like domain-containing protein n=1 Tax=Alcanivorax quisquiliarum TaxID=2933565 RepID=A0ABT0E5A9_9GAMM|nr:hypothetical protein [Alcanivorax quisquiliarum]
MGQAWLEGSRQHRGAVMLEFILLFPFIVAILYAAGYYSVLFSWQYRMQSAVDAAAASGMYVDRSQYADVAAKVTSQANLSLAELAKSLPLAVRGKVEASESNCASQTVAAAGITVIKCEIEMSASEIQAALPAIRFGFLGQFPPAPPNGIQASAQVAF